MTSELINSKLTSVLHFQGHLASVTDSNTNSFVQSLSTGDTVWIGGFRKEDGKDIWGWTDGSAWGFTNWRKGEPNDHSGIEDYVIMNWGNPGLWNDGPIGSKYGFICQYNTLKELGEFSCILGCKKTLILQI